MAGIQVFGRAFGRALRQEFQASQQAAQRAGGGREGTKRAASDTLSGMTIQVKGIYLYVRHSRDAFMFRFITFL